MKRLITSLLIPMTVLAACDGGSGFNGPGDGGPPAAGFTIDLNNGVDVTGVTYKAALSSGEFAGLADPGLIGGGGGGLNKPVLQARGRRHYRSGHQQRSDRAGRAALRRFRHRNVFG